MILKELNFFILFVIYHEYLKTNFTGQQDNFSNKNKHFFLVVTLTFESLKSIQSSFSFWLQSPKIYLWGKVAWFSGVLIAIFVTGAVWQWLITKCGCIDNEIPIWTESVQRSDSFKWKAEKLKKETCPEGLCASWGYIELIFLQHWEEVLLTEVDGIALPCPYREVWGTALLNSFF